MASRIPYLLILILLIAGWNKSFKSQYDHLTGNTVIEPAQSVATPAPQPKPFKPTFLSPIDLGALKGK